MSAQDNGGPAFPFSAEFDGISGKYTRQESDGMSLRDWFAGQAMQGYMASGGNLDIDGKMLGLSRARTCYAMADALLEARKT